MELNKKHARVDVHDQLLSKLWRAHASPVAGARVFQHLPVAGGVGQSRTYINRYFDGHPPFDFSDSKEFPDALVIEVLSAWCKKRGGRQLRVPTGSCVTRCIYQAGIVYMIGIPLLLGSWLEP